jgi:tetratricopeptide (TPR) repeat protein
MRRLTRITLLLLSVLLVFSCAGKKGVQVSTEDNPAHHFLQGMESIEKGDTGGADAKFDRALYLDPNFSPALAGKALVSAMMAAKQADSGHKKVDIEKALEYLDKSKKKVDSKEQKFIYHVTAIRVFTEAKPKGWLDNARDHHGDAVSTDGAREGAILYYESRSAADYFMGAAYWQAYEFRKAEDFLTKVLSSPPAKWHDKADKLYKKVQKISRAAGQFTLTDISKKIAVQEQVTKGDVAAILVDEVHLDRFLAGRIPIASQQPKADFIPADAMTHPFKDEIIIIAKWNVRGLQAQYDQTTRAYLYGPQTPVIRKELALTLEDLLIKLTGDERLATAYIGTERSPFPDVPSTKPWFNSAMNATTRGLMEPDLSGEFRPDAVVDGAELLLAVMKLRNVMNIH